MENMVKHKCFKCRFGNDYCTTSKLEKDKELVQSGKKELKEVLLPCKLTEGGPSPKICRGAAEFFGVVPPEKEIQKIII